MLSMQEGINQTLESGALSLAALPPAFSWEHFKSTTRQETEK